MFYAIAKTEWRPGQPLTPALAPAGLLRTRDAARTVALGRPTLAVSVCYDATRGVVTARGQASGRSSSGWEAPAILDPRGGLTVLAAIPGDLVRLVGPPEIRVHPGSSPATGRPHVRSEGRPVADRRDPPPRVA